MIKYIKHNIYFVIGINEGVKLFYDEELCYKAIILGNVVKKPIPKIAIPIGANLIDVLKINKINNPLLFQKI